MFDIISDVERHRREGGRHDAQVVGVAHDRGQVRDRADQSRIPGKISTRQDNAADLVECTRQLSCSPSALVLDIADHIRQALTGVNQRIHTDGEGSEEVTELVEAAINGVFDRNRRREAAAEGEGVRDRVDLRRVVEAQRAVVEGRQGGVREERFQTTSG